MPCPGHVHVGFSETGMCGWSVLYQVRGLGIASVHKAEHDISKV